MNRRMDKKILALTSGGQKLFELQEKKEDGNMPLNSKKNDSIPY